jgi:hypothetical protein
MDRRDKKKQKGGMDGILWILGPIMALIGFHIIMIIYLNITNNWQGFGINFDFLKSKYNLNYEGWFAYYIILPLHVIFRVLFKPYNNSY